MDNIVLFRNSTISAVIKLMFGAMIISVIIFKLFVSSGSEYEKMKANEEKAKILLRDCWDARDRVEENQGTIAEQRRDIEKISKSLKDGKITSGQLWQEDGPWLTGFRRRVDVREASLAWCRLKVLEAKSSAKLSKAELDEAETLFKTVSLQIDTLYAWYEGLEATHASLWRVMYHIRHEGANPP